MPSSERLLSGRRLRQKQLVKSFGTKRSFLVAAVATDDKPEHSNNARPSFLQSLLGFSAKKEKVRIFQEADRLAAETRVQSTALTLI